MQEVLPCKVRDAILSDRQKIQSILESVGVFNSTEVECAISLFDIYIKVGAKPEEYIFLCAEDAAGKITGFLCYGEASLTHGTYDLYWVATDPLHQKKGIASLLMKALEEQLQKLNARWILAETSSRIEYTSTRRFYTQQDYKIISTIQDYYNAGDDLVVFGKRISAREKEAKN